MVQVILLGTSCMVPTKERNVSAVYLEFNGEGMLFDCGEGTQRQLNMVNIPRTRVRKIFISHWHGDHVSGILGLIQTIGNSKDEAALEMFGPVETKKRLGFLLNSLYFANNVHLPAKDIVPEGLQCIYESESYRIEAISLDHGIPCLGYSFVEKDRLRIKTSEVKEKGIPDGPLLGDLQRGRDISFQGKKHSWKDLTYCVKGKKVTVIMDTSFTKNAITLAKDADLVISEATYLEKHMEKGEKNRHLTVRQAAQIASSAGAKKLVMIHFSQRYNNMSELEEEARSVFPESYVGYDFMKIKI